MLTNFNDQPGLGKALFDAGLPIINEWDGALQQQVQRTDDDAAAQAIIDAWTLADSIAFVRAEILAHAKALRDRVIANVSAGEMASWPIKLAEARSFASDGDGSKCPMLSAEAQARGITVAALVAKVGGNAATFSGLEAAIGGTDGKHRDAIAACTTFEELLAYNWRTGWPEV